MSTPAINFLKQNKIPFEVVTYVPLGTIFSPVAYRGDRLTGMIKCPVPLFWNVSKK